MAPLTPAQIFGGKSQLEFLIPSQVVDIVKTKKRIYLTKSTAQVSGTLYILTFVLMFFLQYGLSMFWGSIRTL